MILRTIANCDNLIGPLLKTMNKGSFSELSLDMLVFSILRNLTDKQHVYQVLDSEAFVCSELRNVSDFTA